MVRDRNTLVRAPRQCSRSSMAADGVVLSLRGVLGELKLARRHERAMSVPRRGQRDDRRLCVPMKDFGGVAVVTAGDRLDASSRGVDRGGLSRCAVDVSRDNMRRQAPLRTDAPAAAHQSTYVTVAVEAQWSHSATQSSKTTRTIRQLSQQRGSEAAGASHGRAREWDRRSACDGSACIRKAAFLPPWSPATRDKSSTRAA